MSIEIITLMLFLFLIAFIFLGHPIGFVLGSTGIIFGFFLWGPHSISMPTFATLGLMKNTTLLSVPLFIGMANILQRSGIANDLYDAMYKLFGGIGGGLAVGTIIISTIFAAMSGISATACVTMGLIALPSMLKRNYDKKLAMGCIMAGGALGPLIPPSVILILYGLFAGESVGALFAGGVFPGLMLSAMFCAYTLVRCSLNPTIGPPLPREERAFWKERVRSLKAVILPLILVILVLGSVFSGAATPTEAASVGAVGSLVCAALNRKLNRQLVKEVATDTLKVVGMIMFIMIGGQCFAGIYNGIGASELIEHTLQFLPGGKWGTLIAIQFSFLILGCLMDATAILMITMPLYIPIVKALGFDLVFFGVLFMVNMELGFLTPPFGFNLFYMKGIAPKDITMGDIYRAVVPFLLIQFTGLVLCMLFPEIILWLPHRLIK